jgi:hypothetical protein
MGAILVAGVEVEAMKSREPASEKIHDTSEWTC